MQNAMRDVTRRGHRVGGLDVQAAGFPVWIVAAPVLPAQDDDFAETVAAMTRYGPNFRAGFHPTPSSRRWIFDERTLDRTLPSLVLSDDSSVEAIMGSLAGVTSTIPIAAKNVAGKYLVLTIDHGIGDAYVMVEILASASCAAKRIGFLDPRPVVNTNHPFFWALVHALKNPVALTSGVRHAFVSRLGNRRGASSIAPSVRIGDDNQEPHTASYVFVRSEPDFVARLKEYRRQSGMKVSLPVLLMSSICDSLRSSGVDIGDDIEVVTDLRKYLPEGRATLANFVSVVSVQCRAGTSPQQLGAALAAEIDSMSPLVNAVGSLGVAVLRRLWAARSRARRQSPPASARRPSKRVVVSFSDLTKLPMDTRVQWADPGIAELAVALPFTSPSRVSLSVLALRGEIQVTAAFSADQVDPSIMRQALHRALWLDFVANRGWTAQGVAGEQADG